MSTSENLKKTSIILTFLGEDIAVEIIKKLPLPEQKKILLALTKSYKASKEEIQKIIAEFKSHLESPSKNRKLPDTETFLQNISNKLPKELNLDYESYFKSKKLVGLNSLEELSGKQFFTNFAEERDSFLSLILSLIASKKASEFIKLFPEERKIQILILMAKNIEISTEKLETIDEWITKKIQKFKNEQAYQVGGNEKAAAILASLGEEASQKILEQIGQKNTGLKNSIDRNMYPFLNILQLEELQQQKLLLMFSDKAWSIALRGLTTEEINKIITYLPSSRKKYILEELEISPPIKKEEIENQRQQIIKKAKEF